jgi:hypothetical protein
MPKLRPFGRRGGAFLASRHASGWIQEENAGAVAAIPYVAISPSKRSRRFPAPWRAVKVPGGYVVRDANGQALAYVYSRNDVAEALQANALTCLSMNRVAPTPSGYVGIVGPVEHLVRDVLGPAQGSTRHSIPPTVNCVALILRRTDHTGGRFGVELEGALGSIPSTGLGSLTASILLPVART